MQGRHSGQQRSRSSRSPAKTGARQSGAAHLLEALELRGLALLLHAPQHGRRDGGLAAERAELLTHAPLGRPRQQDVRVGHCHGDELRFEGVAVDKGLRDEGRARVDGLHFFRRNVLSLQAVPRVVSEHLTW